MKFLASSCLLALGLCLHAGSVLAIGRLSCSTVAPEGSTGSLTVGNDRSRQYYALYSAPLAAPAGRWLYVEGQFELTNNVEPENFVGIYSYIGIGGAGAGTPVAPKSAQFSQPTGEEFSFSYGHHKRVQLSGWVAASGEATAYSIIAWAEAPVSGLALTVERAYGHICVFDPEA